MILASVLKALAPLAVVAAVAEGRDLLEVSCRLSDELEMVAPGRTPRAAQQEDQWARPAVGEGQAPFVEAVREPGSWHLAPRPQSGHDLRRWR